jgi:hypothetical protein
MSGVPDMVRILSVLPHGYRVRGKEATASQDDIHSVRGELSCAFRERRVAGITARCASGSIFSV